ASKRAVFAPWPKPPCKAPISPSTRAKPASAISKLYSKKQS
ncbi:uncharacterized protein METZ01_LOCUS442231, partial [marine metagenome]